VFGRQGPESSKAGNPKPHRYERQYQDGAKDKKCLGVIEPSLENGIQYLGGQGDRIDSWALQVVI